MTILNSALHILVGFNRAKSLAREAPVSESDLRSTYKTKLKLDKEVGGGGGISERTREPNERTGGTGERPESTSGPRGASATDRGGISERTRERHERTGGTSERPYMTSP